MNENEKCERNHLLAAAECHKERAFVCSEAVLFVLKYSAKWVSLVSGTNCPSVCCVFTARCHESNLTQTNWRFCCSHDATLISKRSQGPRDGMTFPRTSWSLSNHAAPLIMTADYAAEEESHGCTQINDDKPNGV